MERFKINVVKIISVTAEDIDDIMCTALESGITYWCNKAEVVGDYLGKYAHEQIARNGVLKLYDAESDEIYTLTRDKLLNGIKLAIEANCLDVRAEYGWHIDTKIDTCCIDAEIADVIVQMALFDDVIFG